MDIKWGVLFFWGVESSVAAWKSTVTLSQRYYTPSFEELIDEFFKNIGKKEMGLLEFGTSHALPAPMTLRYNPDLAILSYESLVHCDDCLILSGSQSQTFLKGLCLEITGS